MVFSRFPTRFPALFQAFPGRFTDAWMMTFVSVVGVFIGDMYHQPLLELYPIFVLPLWKSTRPELLRMALLFAIAMTYMITEVFIGLYLGINSNLMKFMTIAIFAFISFFVSVSTKYGPLAMISTLMACFLLLQANEITNAPTLLQIVLDLYLVSLASALLMALAALFLSPSPKKSLCSQIAWRLQLAADILEGSNQEGLLKETDRVLTQAAAPMLTNVALMSKEGRFNADVLNRLRQSSLNAFAVLDLARLCAVDYGREYLEKSDFSKKLAQIIKNMIPVFERGDIASVDETQIVYKNSTFEAAKDQTALARIKDLLAHFSDHSDITFPTTPQYKFFFPGCWNITNVTYALKGTIAVVLCMCFYLALDWPGIHTCVITCFLVGLPTTGEMIDKQFQRISGAIVGALISMFSIICILPCFTNIAQLIILISLIVGLAAWIKMGPDKTSYAGFQIAVIMALSDLGKPTPTFDLTIARDRVIGILIGMMFSYVIFTRLWPVSSATKLPPLFNEVFAALKQQSDAEDTLSKIYWASNAHASLSNVERMLGYSREEPVSVRPNKQIMTDYKKSVSIAHELIEILLLPDTSYTNSQAQKRLTQLRDFLKDAGVTNLSLIAEKFQALPETETAKI